MIRRGHKIHDSGMSKIVPALCLKGGEPLGWLDAALLNLLDEWINLGIEWNVSALEMS